MKRIIGPAAALAILWGSGAGAQEQELIAEGEMAPDIEMTGSTRHGVLRDPIRLSNYRGETVVLAFFFRVRTRG